MQWTPYFRSSCSTDSGDPHAASWRVASRRVAASIDYFGVMEANHFHVVALGDRQAIAMCDPRSANQSTNASPKSILSLRQTRISSCHREIAMVAFPSNCKAGIPHHINYLASPRTPNS